MYSSTLPDPSMDGTLMRINTTVALAALSLSLATGCREQPAAPVASHIYTNGNVITLDGTRGTVEALAIADGKILAVGSQAEVLPYQGGATQLIDLDGKTLLPGFVDAHSHLSGVAIQAISANLLPAPDGPVNNISALQQTLRDYMASSAVVAEHGIVIGFNYDDSQLDELRHPTRHDLDAVSTELPVVVLHQSGHMGAYNSLALKMVGIGPESADPAGGIIEREADGKTPSGVLQENAHFAVIYKLMPEFTEAQYSEVLRAGTAIYAANGFTTVQDGKTDLKTLETFATLSARGIFDLDVVSYVDLTSGSEDPLMQGPLLSPSYTHNFRIGGVKLTLDGSPQGKTAWFTQPYLSPPRGQAESYAGYGAFTNAEALKWISLAYENDWQLLVHTNGDAAIDQLLSAVDTATAAHPGTDRRTVMIHGQFLRQDQMPKLNALEIFPALFPMHTFYWGDWHRDSVAGLERAENISPTGWMVEQGMKFSIHSDAPVAFPSSMRILHSAVNRTTRSGAVLGKRHLLNSLDALKAMTIWPAFQHFEEQAKGSLVVGKLADLVILDKNPLTESPDDILSIRVLETIKEGRTIYSAPH
jgi:predicted amidohydrolase YtcJ